MSSCECASPAARHHALRHRTLHPQSFQSLTSLDRTFKMIDLFLARHTYSWQRSPKTYACWSSSSPHPTFVLARPGWTHLSRTRSQTRCFASGGVRERPRSKGDCATLRHTPLAGPPQWARALPAITGTPYHRLSALRLILEVGFRAPVDSSKGLSTSNANGSQAVIWVIWGTWLSGLQTRWRFVVRAACKYHTVFGQKGPIRLTHITTLPLPQLPCTGRRRCALLGLGGVMPPLLRHGRS